MQKPNYQFEKRKKDLGKKAKKEEKRQRKLDRDKAQPAGIRDVSETNGTKQPQVRVLHRHGLF